MKKAKKRERVATPQRERRRGSEGPVAVLPKPRGVV
jgi:hypothetical protein